MDLAVFGTKQRLKKIIPITVVMSVATGSLIQILQMKDYWLAGVLQRPEINQKGYGFADFPIVKEYGIDNHSHLQSRYLKVSYLLKNKIECEAETPNLIILDPSILLSKGRYHGPNYIQQYNDLSGLMVLYLREIGVDAMYVLVSDEGESGTIFPGEGYAGRSRVFSGPIIWQKNLIEYISSGSTVFTRKGGVESKSTIFIAFSEAEATGIRSMGLANSELLIKSLGDMDLAKACKAS